MPERYWTKPLARAALLLLVLDAPWTVFAQAPAGAISIRLTDLYSKPLEGASVALRNRVTGALVHANTAKGGVYRFAAIDPGDYTLEASSPHLGTGSLAGIQVDAGHEARIQAALEFTPGPQNVAAIGASEPVIAKQPVLKPEKPDDLAAMRAPEMLPKAIQPLPTVMSLPAAIASASGLPAAGASVASLGGACVANVAVQAGTAALRIPPQLAEQVTEQIVGQVQNAPEQVTPATTAAAGQFEALPLAGRNWQSFLPDHLSNQSQETSGAQTEDARPVRASSSLIDGADTTLAFGNPHAANARGPGAALMGPGTNEATLRAVQLASENGELASYRGAVSRPNAQSERGGSRLHGQSFLFDRENLWGAQNPFTQWVQQTAPATSLTVPVFAATPYTPSNRERIWGAGAGGPLRRRKAFWFAAVDAFERNDPGVSTVKHPDDFFAQPSNDEMQVLSARLGLSSTNPIAEGLGAYSGMLQSLDGLLGPAPRTSSQWTGFGRIDWTATDRQSFTLEGTGARWDAPGGGLTGASETYGSRSYGVSRADDQWALGRWERFLTPNLLAVTQGSVGRQFLTAVPENPSPFEQSFNNNDWGRLPQMTVDSRYGFTIGNPSRFGPGGNPDEHLYEGQEQLSWVRGNGLLIKAGFDLRHNKDATGFLRNQTGTYNYASAENFASDALSFAAFGLSGQLNPVNQHNCDQTGKVWRDSAGGLHGLGDLPCYSWYSQTMGPANWWLSTNDWASYSTVQWQRKKSLVASIALRWEMEQSPSPIALLDNPNLPLTEKMPALGSQWAPRASVAWGSAESRWPVLRLGYGMYFGRTMNSTFENALTQTGSLKGDLNLFMRPTDNLNAGGAPPFPYVLAGEPATVVKPGAVEFAPGFRNGEAHQAVASVEETLAGQVRIEASAVASLGRRLPVTEDANIDPAVNPQTITYAVVDGNGSGPIKSTQITVPFFASWPSATSPTGFAGRLNPNYQQVTEIVGRANSTYEAAVVRLTRTGRSGLTLHARYAYAHAMDWNPNESANVGGPSVFDPTDFRAEYSVSNLDVRHSVSVFLIWEPRSRLRGEAGKFTNGWMLSEVGSLHTGSPFTMRTAGSLATEFDTTGAAIVGLAPGINGYGGDDRIYGVGRNTYRYPATWKADLRLAKRFHLGEMRQLELLAESFNLFNHQNVTELETVGYSIESGSVNGSFPTLNFLTGLKTGQTEFGQPLNINATDFYRPRQIQFGMRVRF